MNLALHRSITFWCGLLVMGFVCWAWSDSMNYFSGGNRHHFQAVHFDGAVYLEYSPGVMFPATAGREPEKPANGNWKLAPAALLRGGGKDGYLDHLHQ